MGSSSSKSSRRRKQNGIADAMTEYHRDSGRYHQSQVRVGPDNKFGSWQGNKQRKDYYRQQHHKSQVQYHDGERRNWNDRYS